MVIEHESLTLDISHILIREVFSNQGCTWVAGSWILRCHTALHTNAGMQALFTVESSSSATALALLPAAVQSRGSLVSALAFMSQVPKRDEKMLVSCIAIINFLVCI